MFLGGRVSHTNSASAATVHFTNPTAWLRHKHLTNEPKAPQIALASSKLAVNSNFATTAKDVLTSENGGYTIKELIVGTIYAATWQLLALGGAIFGPRIAVALNKGVSTDFVKVVGVAVGMAIGATISAAIMALTSKKLLGD